jgi:hypothetical protein
VDSVVSMRTSSGIDTASMRSNSGIDAGQLSRIGSDVSEQAHDSAAATAAEGVLPLSPQQQQQQMAPLRTSSGGSSTSPASGSSSMRSSSGTQPPQRWLPAAIPLAAALGNPRVRLPTVASGSNLGTLAEGEGEAETGADSCTNQQQQQQQGLQGGLAVGGSSSASPFGQLTNMWTSEGGGQKVVCVPRRTASANVAALQQHVQMHQQQHSRQQQSLQEQMLHMGMRDMQPSPVQVQLGPAAAQLLRVQSVNKPAAAALAGASSSSCRSSRDVPGIIAGSLTQLQAAGIHMGRLCGAGSFGRVYRCGSLTKFDQVTAVV